MDPASKTSRREIVFLLIALVITAAIIFLSLGNGVQLPNRWFGFKGVDKVQHVAAYAVTALAWLAAFRQNKSSIVNWRRRVANISKQRLWVLLFLLGAALELCQWAFYPNRYFEFADMLANGVGAGVGVIIFERIFPF